MTDEKHEPTILSPEEAALVTTNDGVGLRLCLPTAYRDDGGELPPMVAFLTAIFMRSDDPEWVGEQMNWLQDRIAEGASKN